MIYLQLFYEFFKAGLFAIGGGLATLPFLSDISVRTAWYTQEQLMNMIAISESTPGPLGINTATYVGFTTTGNVFGSIIATLGLIAPSIIIIILISQFLKAFRKSKIVENVFYGLRPASTALIAAAGASVMLVSLFNQGKTGMAFFNLPALILAALLWLFSNKVKQTKGLHPIVFIAISAVVGIVFRFAGV